MIFDQCNFQKREIPIITNWKEIEEAATFQLPEDYQYFLKNYHEYNGFIGPEFLQMWSYEHLLEYNNRYGIIKNLTKTFGIGSNGAGEFLAIELIEPSKYHLVLSPFIDLSKECHIEIGTSFSDMLARLVNGKEWFK